MRGRRCIGKGQVKRARLMLELVWTPTLEWATLHLTGPPLHLAGPPLNLARPPPHLAGAPLHLAGPLLHLSRFLGKGQIRVRGRSDVWFR